MLRQDVPAGCDVARVPLIAVALGLVAGNIAGCGSSARFHSHDKSTCGSPWCSSMWSKSYDRVLSPSGFDSIVAPCPGGANDFYDRRAKRIDGKYEWYCASRTRYFEAPPRSVPLGVVGYHLAPHAELSISDLTWPPNAFQRFVSFKHNFYPLGNGQCYLDFADMKVGGGVFRNGLAQEETLMLQLPELLLVVRERARKQPLYLSTLGDWHHNSDVITFTNVVRPVATIPKDIAVTCGRSPRSAWPCTDFAAQQRSDPAMVSAVIAINAQQFQHDGFYSATEFDFLANKLLAAFGAAQEAGCGNLNSGALGAGVFNGNIHLAVMLHAVMSVAFNMPVTMWSVQKPESLDELLAVLEKSPTLTIQNVLNMLRRDVSWGHGPNNRDIVQIQKSMTILAE